MNQTHTDVAPAEMAFERWQGSRRLVEIGVLVGLFSGAIVTLPGLGDLRERLAGPTRL